MAGLSGVIDLDANEQRMSSQVTAVAICHREADDLRFFVRTEFVDSLSQAMRLTHSHLSAATHGVPTPMTATAINSSRYASIDVSNLKSGTMLRTPILEDRDDRDVLLLARGTRITDKVLALLESRGVTRIRVDGSEVARLTGVEESSSPVEEVVQRASRQGERTSNRRFSCSPKSFVNRVATHGTNVYDKQATQEFSQNFQSSVTQIENLFDSLLVGDVVDASKIAAVSSESLVKITEDLDLFVAMGLQPATDKYPCKHSLQAGMLAMSIGTILGLSHEELIELGIGCLMHDAGMLHIDYDLLASRKKLSAVEFLEITKHPIIQSSVTT